MSVSFSDWISVSSVGSNVKVVIILFPLHWRYKESVALQIPWRHCNCENTSYLRAKFRSLFNNRRTFIRFRQLQREFSARRFALSHFSYIFIVIPLPWPSVWALPGTHRTMLLAPQFSTVQRNYRFNERVSCLRHRSALFLSILLHISFKKKHWD